MPGVLIEGGPLGLDEDRACRLRPADGASLRGSARGPSERIAASPGEDIVAVMLLFVVNGSSWQQKRGRARRSVNALRTRTAKLTRAKLLAGRFQSRQVERSVVPAKFRVQVQGLCFRDGGAKDFD